MPTVSYSGLASGVDSTALIESILAARRRSSIDPLKTRISELTDTNSAFSELTGLLEKLKSAAARFRTVNGGTIAKQATSSDETILTASASDTAATGTFSLTVSNLAKRATQSFTQTYGSTTDLLAPGIVGSDGDRTASFTIGAGSEAEAVSVVVTDSMTAEQFVTAFNEQSSRATASLINTGTSASPAYRLVITSNETGVEEGQLITSLGASFSGILTAETVDQAENAEFQVAGISGTIIRGSNTVSDLFPGVTLRLQDLGAATVSVGTNRSEAVSRVQEFVDAYNDVFLYIREQDLVSQEQDGGNVRNIFGPLAGTAIDENVLSSLRGALSSAGITGTTVNVLADLGVTTQRDGTLALNSSTLEAALAENPSSVEEILGNLGESLAAVDGTIAQFTRFNGILGSARNSNESQISTLNSRIADIESQLAKQEEALIRQFSQLEAVTGRLQSQQQALAGILPR